MPDDSATGALVDPARSPLGDLRGARPSAPAWFDAAIAQPPERTRVDVEGAPIEMLAWGRRGDPGVLLLHGFAANADWWAFIAPQLARGRRVVASSWSGMGGSGWRDAYSMDQHAREAIAVAEAGGLFESDTAPVVVGHSYGCLVTLLIAQDHGDRLKAVVAMDGPLSADRKERVPGGVGPAEHKVYATLEDALARFRFTPSQTCENLYIADYIARASVVQANGGWSWRFDPNIRGKMGYADVERLMAPPRCPVALVFGDRSQLMTPERRAFMGALVPPGAPVFDIPDAGHHVMVDQPLTVIAGLDGLLSGWPCTTQS